MDTYSVSFVDSSGNTTTEFDFGAGAEIEIATLTELLSKACDEQGSGFELRRGTEIIAGRKPPRVKSTGRNRWIRSVAISAVAVLAFSGGFVLTSDHMRLAKSHDPTPVDFKQRMNTAASISQISRGVVTDKVPASDDETAMLDEAMLKAYAEYQRIMLGFRSFDEPTGARASGRPKQSVRTRYEKPVFKRRSSSRSPE